ncbi:MAG: helix-turn-helix domain-containing protein [Methanothrix sp.]|uniref:ArsR/SmtB family transcription factor n=1 Tax=Methanothrix sp. TaxID=90426 RepID=UPI0025E5D926|nr:ArsR family transcriptional regulator [Methanothrix sp.]MCQ8903102.1 helix-turn-helix domain-containing protein [Methanothrix sp.]
MFGLDPVELLDVLGNENRRRILQLLSFRPFYFNEIAKRLDVGPKAVIDHLGVLESAGLIECYRDERRRKYFRLARNLVLEVALASHSYGVRAYALSGPSMERESDCRDLRTIHEELSALAAEMDRLRMMMADVATRELELRQKAMRAIDECATDELEAELLFSLLSGSSTEEKLAERLKMPAAVVRESLARLESRGLVRFENGSWSI